MRLCLDTQPRWPLRWHAAVWRPLRGLVIDKIRCFGHRRVDPQIFVSEFALFVRTGNGNPHEDVVGMHRSYDAHFVRAVNANSIAGLEHGYAPVFSTFAARSVIPQHPAIRIVGGRKDSVAAAWLMLIIPL